MKIDIYQTAGDKPYTSIDLQIPYRIKTFSDVSAERIKEITIEEIRLQTSTILEIIEYFSDEIRQNDKIAQDLIEYVLTLAPIGRGLQECLDLLDRDIEEALAPAKEKSAPLDLSVHPESVQRLNKPQMEKLIKKHKLPEEVANVLRDCAEVKQ